MKKAVKTIIYKIVLVSLCFAMLVLSCFYLRDLPKAILLAAIVTFASLGVIIAGLDAERYEVAFKFFMVAAIFMAFVLAGYVIADLTGLIYKFQSVDALIMFVRGTKQWGVLVYIGIVIFQVVVLPIPSIIVALLGSMLYEPFFGFVFMSIGTIIGSILTFALGKIFGKKLVNWMIGAEKTEKYAELLNEKGRSILILMFLFPFFPDDIICLVAGVTKMSYKYFIMVVSLTRPVMIAFYCFFGSGSIIPFTGWGIPVWIALFVATAITFVLITKLKRKFETKKTRNEKK